MHKLKTIVKRVEVSKVVGVQLMESQPIAINCWPDTERTRLLMKNNTYTRLYLKGTSDGAAHGGGSTDGQSQQRYPHDEEYPSRLDDEQYATEMLEALERTHAFNESQQSPGIASNWSNQTTPIPHSHSVSMDARIKC
ncbi:hypothetical protein PV325_012484 [Microctonus aethiopoides]|nr:hypothetical protein PV325_012484 [Microctonus aethiopoides]